MEVLPIPYAFLQNKDLTVFDALILAYINDKKDSEYQFIQSNIDISKALNINPATLPNVISKLFKLGYLEESHESGHRTLTYTYDSPHRYSKSGFIYIMKDTTHPYLKIGYSNNPSYRESTLQGEKPTIELIAKYKGTMQQEQTCHRILAKYRKRGEWFEVPLELAINTIKRVTGIQ